MISVACPLTLGPTLHAVTFNMRLWQCAVETLSWQDALQTRRLSYVRVMNCSMPKGSSHLRENRCLAHEHGTLGMFAPFTKFFSINCKVVKEVFRRRAVKMQRTTSPLVTLSLDKSCPFRPFAQLRPLCAANAIFA